MSIKRSTEIGYHENVRLWFRKNPDAKTHFIPLKKFIENHYEGENIGFINMKNSREFRVNSTKEGGYLKVFVNKSYSRVRLYAEENDLEQKYIDDHFSLIKRKRVYIGIVEFIVYEASDIEKIKQYLKLHPINNFKAIVDEIYSTATDAPETVQFRLTNSKVIKVCQYHLELQKSFYEWLKSKNGEGIQPEYLRGDRDRIDMLFKFNNKIIFAELKSARNSSPKRSIREALGQLLDYQYYSGDKKAHSLWIVLDIEPTEQDKKFIKNIVKSLSLNLKLVWQKSNFKNKFTLLKT